MGLLLGSFDLFYPLLIVSVILFLYTLMKRCWIAMIFSAIFLYPVIWYFSGYPPFTWVKIIPFIQVVVALVFFQMKRTKLKT